MKSFSQIRESFGGLPDPPAIMTLRRVGVRMMPGKQRVALYKNSSYGVEFTLPYDVDMVAKHGIAAGQGVVKEDHLTELSNQTLNAYQHKATLDAVHNMSHNAPPDWSSPEHKHAEKRLAGVREAGRRLEAKKGIKEEALHGIHSAVEFSHHAKAHGADRIEWVKKAPHEDATNINGKWVPHSSGPRRKLVAYKGNREIGHFDAEHLHGHLKEADEPTSHKYINEGVIHKLHHIFRTKQPGDVQFKNGKSSRVPHGTAALIMKLHGVLTPQNKQKIESLVNSSPEGLQKVASWAAENIK